jgi:hypothetical protein
MDGSTFDKLSQIVSHAGTRRSALSALVAAGLGGVALSSAEAKGKGKKKRKRKCKGNTAGKPCTTDKTCCTSKTKNICRVPSNGGNSDTFCCGGPGAPCRRNTEGDIGDEVPPVCCTGFPCNAAPGGTGTCQPQPPDDL